VCEGVRERVGRNCRMKKVQSTKGRRTTPTQAHPNGREATHVRIQENDVHIKYPNTHTLMHTLMHTHTHNETQHYTYITHRKTKQKNTNKPTNKQTHTPTPADHTKAVDHGGVRIGAHHAIREEEAVLVEDGASEVLEVDLVYDTPTGGNDAEVVEGVRTPLEELEAFAVTFHLTLLVSLQGVRPSGHVHLHRVIDHHVRWAERVDLGRITAQPFHGLALVVGGIWERERERERESACVCMYV
jgi:hypothetical protein